MNYQIVIDPALEVDLTAVAEAWNRDPQTQQVATAQVEEKEATSFSVDPALVQQAILLLTSALGGAAATLAAVPLEVVRDLFKEKLQAYLQSKLEKPPQLSVEWAETDEGYLLIVGEG